MISMKLRFLETLFPKYTSRNLFYIILIISPILIPLQVFGHGEKDEYDKEVFVLSQFVNGNIELSKSSEQWSDSFEKDFDSIWDHDISVKSLNNGTHVFFLLSWEDSTKDDVGEINDGAIIIIKSKLENASEHDEIENVENIEGINEVWRWDSSNPEESSDIILDSSWENQKWTVIFGRSVLTSEHDKISFEPGVKQEDFMEIAVWDGSLDESFEQIEDLPHADFILLPEINSSPKDVFVWSALLVVGAVSFLFVERKLHYKKEVSLNE